MSYDALISGNWKLNAEMMYTMCGRLPCSSQEEVSVEIQLLCVELF